MNKLCLSLSFTLSTRTTAGDSIVLVFHPIHTYYSWWQYCPRLSPYPHVLQLVTIRTTTERTQSCTGTDIGIQGDDPDCVVSQTHSQEATSLLSCWHATQRHAYHIRWHLFALCVLVQLTCLQTHNDHSYKSAEDCSFRTSKRKEKKVIVFLKMYNYQNLAHTSIIHDTMQTE